MIRAVVIAAIVSAAAIASAQPAAQGDDEAPVVDVADLPPLPDAGDLGAGSRVALASASEVGEDLVTGAAKREQSLGNVASAVTVIPGDRLRRFGYRTVAEALRAVAGLYVVDDRMTERLGVRGLQLLGDFNTRILVLIDGATANEPWNQFAGLAWDLPVTIDEIARIEVIRGPVSSVYGTNAFFGILNIVTRTATESPRAWGRVSGGTFGIASARAGLAAGDLDHQIRATVGALYRGGETVTIPELGEDLDADGERALTASVAGSYQGAFGQLRVMRRRRELTGAPYDTAIGDPDNTTTDMLLLTEAGYTRDVTDAVTVTGRVYLDRYRYEELLGFSDGDFTGLGDSFWYGAELRARSRLIAGDGIDRLGLTAGAELTLVDTEADSAYVGGEDRVVVPASLSQQGLYAELDGAPLPWLSFTAGLRVDRNSELENRVSPRAALLLSRGERAGAKLLYAEGFRNPSTYEAFYQDGVDFAANPGLRAETIRSLELVLWARPRAGVSARLSAFRWAADRLIEQEEIMVGSEPLLQFQNLGALTSTGLEAEASYRDSRGWLAFAGATLARVESVDSDEPALNAPAWTVSAGVSSPLLGGVAHVSSDVAVIGSRHTRDPERDADPYAGWNLAIYAPDLRGVDVTIQVRNLLGVREEVPTQEDYDRTDPDELLVPVLPGQGRELHASIGIRY